MKQRMKKNHLRLLRLLVLVVCLILTSCGAAGDFLWGRPGDDTIDPDVLVIPGGGEEQETKIIMEGAVNFYEKEYRNGTDIRYIGKGERKDRIIVIDAGHQAEGNDELEPNGPNSDVMVAKMTEGGKGVKSGDEQTLTLEMARLLRNELYNRGYSIVMIRETADVNISEKERAEVANAVGAAAYIRLHASSNADDGSMSGARAICQSADNPYPCVEMYEDSRLLSSLVLKSYCDESDISVYVDEENHTGVFERDDITGINWSTVPTTTLELGFLTNQSDDMLMALPTVKSAATKGIADGIDKFIDTVSQRQPEESDTVSWEDLSEAVETQVVETQVVETQVADTQVADTQMVEAPATEADQITDAEAEWVTSYLQTEAQESQTAQASREEGQTEELQEDGVTDEAQTEEAEIDWVETDIQTDIQTEIMT